MVWDPNRVSVVGTAVGVMLTVMFAFGNTMFWQLYYADFIEFIRSKSISDSLLYGVWATIQFWSIQLGSAIIFTIFHMNEFAFVEKYKTNDDPWPWQADKDAWNIQMWSTIKLVALNTVVVTPLAGLTNYLTGVPVVNDFSVGAVPTVGIFVF